MAPRTEALPREGRRGQSGDQVGPALGWQDRGEGLDEKRPLRTQDWLAAWRGLSSARRGQQEWGVNFYFCLERFLEDKKFLSECFLNLKKSEQYRTRAQVLNPVSEPGYRGLSGSAGEGGC